VSEADRPLAVCPQPLDDRAGRLDRLRRQAECPREHVRAAAGNHRESRGVGSDALAQQAADDLVDRAVTADRDDDVEPVGARLGGQVGRVSAAVRLDGVDLQFATERANDDVSGSWAHGGRARVGHQQRSHPRKGTPGVLRRCDTDPRTLSCRAAMVA
jgi:hypothetical protein